MKFWKYSGAGNDFLILDGRRSDLSAYRVGERVAALCDRRKGVAREGFRTGADGLMILGPSTDCDFSMEYYNPDGSSGMMCGNGGRCIAAFASLLGIRPAVGETYRFEAPDSVHEALLLPEGRVRLSMKDVAGVSVFEDGYFLDTGTRHFVRFVPDVEAVDVEAEGPVIRRSERFSPEGVNVNFVSPDPDGTLRVRTFEKGVEAETLACGTGIVASAVAAGFRGIPPTAGEDYLLRARGGLLSVSYRRGLSGAWASSVFLTGPTELLYQGEID